MEKRNKIIYWVATIWLSLGMITSGIVQLLPMEEEVVRMRELGYPVYFLTILGVWKFLGVITVLAPKLPLLKEWAYAGFFFLVSGAIFTHIAVGDPVETYFGPGLLLILTLVSWYFRPSDRKILIQSQ
jgi:hypothetical protein